MLAQYADPSDPHAEANIGPAADAIKSGFSSALTAPLRSRNLGDMGPPVPDAQRRTLQAIRDLLTGRGIRFRELHHEPTYTSEQSAAARGESVEIGGKAIVMKVDDAFHLFVLSAARSVDSAAIRRRLHARRSRFATPDELLELTGLVPGSVPPFGRPVLDLDLYADEAMLTNTRIAFNAGSLTDSIILAMPDYLSVAAPVVFGFSKPPT